MSPVSVLMPMRNARPYIQAAIRSVLAQPGVDLELIVVDDGSTDGSRDVALAMHDPRLRLVDGPHQGVAAAFNAGLQAARGHGSGPAPILARCDADDLFAPDRLARQVRWLEEHPEFAAVCGSFATITAKGKPVAELDCGRQAQEITAELRQGTVRTHLCTYAIRTELLVRIGGCRTWFASAEDLDLQFRLAEAGRIWFQPHQDYLYRLHDASITHTQPNAARLFFEQMARQFQAQRIAGRQDDLDRGCPPEPPSHRDAPSPSAAQIQGMLVARSWQEHRGGHKRLALGTGWRACLEPPAQLRRLEEPGRPDAQIVRASACRAGGARAGEDERARAGLPSSRPVPEDRDPCA